MGSRYPETLLPLTMDRNPRHPRRNRDASTRKIAVLVVCLCALMCVGVVVYVHLVVNSITDRLSRTDEQKISLKQVVPSHQLPELLKRSLETRPRPRRKTPHRPERNQPTDKLPPFIHLFGKSNAGNHKEENYIYFTWDKDENTSPAGFQLVGGNEGYHKVIIKQTGVYLVYAQVAVNGRETINKPYECSHDTVCTRGTKRIILLSSLVTQYQLGGRYEQNEDSEGLRALDTTVHMGVFLLFKDDVLSVQYPEDCGSMKYSKTKEHSYFGLARLNGNKEPRPPRTPRPPKAPRTKRD